jgi:hypothetical protein
VQQLKNIKTNHSKVKHQAMDGVSVIHPASKQTVSHLLALLKNFVSYRHYSTKWISTVWDTNTWLCPIINHDDK